MFRTELYDEQKHLNHLLKWMDYWKLKDFKNNNTIEKFKYRLICGKGISKADSDVLALIEKANKIAKAKESK